MQDRPTAAELLAAVREFLDDEARPNLDGRLAFHARVAANALAIVERELLDGARFAAAERERAAALLGHDGSPEALERELARRIRDGSLDTSLADVRRHVRATVREKLLVANPGYLDDATTGADDEPGA
jgi:hypothetical protein